MAKRLVRLPSLLADLPSCKAEVAARLKAKKMRCRPMPAARTPSRAVMLMVTPDMTALLICIQGTSMSNMELSTDIFFLLLSTHLATAAAAEQGFAAWHEADSDVHVCARCRTTTLGQTCTASNITKCSVDFVHLGLNRKQPYCCLPLKQ